MLLLKGQQYPKMQTHADLQRFVTFQHIFQHFGPRTEHHSEGSRNQNNTKWNFYKPDDVVALSLHKFIRQQEN